MSQYSERTTEPPSGQQTGFKGLLTRFQMAHGRKLVIALPYLWLSLLFLLPFLIVLKISFADIARAIPPYTELLSRIITRFKI